MAESESGVDRGNNNVGEDDCPLCLEPLPPFWDLERRTSFMCCGKHVCKGCHDGKMEFLNRAYDSGSFGNAERQLNNFCPLCRTEKPASDGCVGKMLNDKFEEGQLQLHLYGDLGCRYLKGRRGVEVDVERGEEILMLGAERGDPNCQFLLGRAYHEEDCGLAKSSQDAKRWFLAATEQGHAIAEYGLAIVFKEEGNDADFVRYMRSSASKGYDSACYNLGLAHYKGLFGAPKSTEEAIRVLIPAAERVHAPSMGLLGEVMVDPAHSVAPWYNPNFTKGMHWTRRAAQMGDEHAISDLESFEEDASGWCFMCKKKAPAEKAFLRCSRCRAAWYCSKNCQVQHWKAGGGGHKQCCIKWG